MFILIFCISLVLAPIYCICEAIAGRKKNTPPMAPPPKPQDPMDRHMDETYGDIDWLRKGKL